MRIASHCMSVLLSSVSLGGLRDDLQAAGNQL